MKKQRLFRFLCSLILFSVPLVFAQTPTPEQLQMFKNLPAEQQQALMKQYGVALPPSEGQVVAYPTPEVIEPRNEGNKKSRVGDENDNSAEQEGELQRFGVELFAGSPTTFAPISEAPVPADYTVGPGDEIVVQLYGKENDTHRLRVNRDGGIQFPELGPLKVSGLTFSQLRDSLTQRVEEQMIGVRSDITLGEMRSMQIFVMGDAYKPGAYTVSALTTISQAIYVSGGFSDTGALRNIQLKRNGKLVRQLDMYDLLLKGDTSNDVRLMPGDVVWIDSLGSTVTIDGEINRPAIYEVKVGERYQDLIRIAGGFTANALPEKVQVKRYVKDNQRHIQLLDLTSQRGKAERVQTGDIVQIPTRKQKLSKFVQVLGDVEVPGFLGWKKGMRISDVFNAKDNAFNSTADINYSLVVRETNLQRDIEVKQFSLANAILEPSSKDNLKLESRDRILVFNKLSAKALNSLLMNDASIKSLEQARREAEKDKADKTNNQDLSNTAKVQAQVERMLAFEQISPHELERLRSSTRQALLAPVLLKLRQQSRYGLAPEIAEITGEVKFPGIYPITEGMKLSGLLKSAGGLTYSAYSNSAELARYREDSHTQRGFIDIQRVALDGALRGDVHSDIEVLGRDKFNIFTKPDVKRNYSVILEGEVRFPGTYTIRTGETLAELLERAGGLTDQAHPRGAIFTREALRVQEEKLLQQYAEEVRKETAKKSLRADSNMASSIGNPESTLSFIEESAKSKALGRMVVQLDRVLAGDVSADFMLEDGDFLFVPTFRKTVSIMGEVQVSITYLLDEKLDINDYLSKAGGFKKQADDDRIFVIRADGSVFKPELNGWFSSVAGQEKLMPGDTIVVPLDTHYRDALSWWTAATQVLYQTGVAVNAIN
ncbi:OtnA protein [Vibrio sp. JPW-9-11-11]|uniref:SLBB domain-containing protein n=1 Tax=Vibrio sp. JPW-9-11-11 TaxID=1416532 RepID=UPI001592CE3D|nr:SLBB domain-containing protein [Vibrio sp. JPW-9-11-11]NVD05413.1 OtnA protein [Vibrio sp. JPW-9-11-11]